MDKVYIRDANNQYEETAASIGRDGFTYEWSKNQTDQVSFTADNDRSLAYALLQVESSVIFNGQEYVIKQSEQKYDGLDETKDVTATAVRYEVARVYQTAVKSGTLTYAIEDVLHFFFDKNEYGFTWEVKGTFAKAEIENLGDGSGKDCIDKCVDAFNCVVMADNKHLIFYTVEAFQTATQKVYHYGSNTTSFSVKTDSSSIQNIAVVYGKQKDATDDSDKTEYYFTPFTVQDDDSIKRWGKRPGASISDERFTIAADMKTYALSTMQTQPLTEMTITYDGDDTVNPGDVWELEVQSENFITDVTVDGIKTYPLAIGKSPEITLDNSYRTLYDYDRQMQNDVKRALNSFGAFSSRIENIGISTIDGGESNYQYTGNGSSSN